MRTLIIYHSRDLDGWCSGAIAYRYYKNLDKEADVILLGYDYGDPIPIQAINGADRIVVLDVSFKLDFMLQLAAHEDNFIWIDHHKSAINEVAEHTDVKQIDGLRDTNYAACELAWFYYYPNVAIPRTIQLLGLYDSFRHKGTDDESKVMSFQYAARARWASVKDILNSSWIFDRQNLYVSDMIDTGKDIHRYLTTTAKQVYNKRGEVDFDGFKFAVVNSERINPINFGIEYHKDGYDGFACYWDTPTGRTWSLYNDDGRVDCSVICKARGGGGHKGAAGFIQDITFPPYAGALEIKEVVPMGDYNIQYVSGSRVIERDKDGNPLISATPVIIDMGKDPKDDIA